jgi:hypothetical protein
MKLENPNLTMKYLNLKYHFNDYDYLNHYEHDYRDKFFGNACYVLT